MPTFTGKIEKGVLLGSKELNKFITSQKDSKVKIRIDKWKTQRTLNQNNLYWLQLEFIGKEIGEDNIEGLHNFFKSEFLIDRTKKIPIIKSTTQLNTAEMSEYMDKINRRVADFGIILPQPDDDYWEELLKEY